MITRIGIVGVWVSDQSAAIDFYVGKLGFELLTDIGDESDYRWVVVAPKGAETGIALAKPEGPIDPALGKKPEDLVGTSRFIFDTDDIAETYRDLSGKGVIFTEPPSMQPWGMMQAQFLDQDGNNFILVERISIRI